MVSGESDFRMSQDADGYVLVTGWREHRVTGDGRIETVGYTLRRRFPDSVPLDVAKAELRAICEREENRSRAQRIGLKKAGS